MSTSAVSSSPLASRPIGALDGTPVYLSAQTVPGLAGAVVASYLAAWISRPRWTGSARLALTAIWWLAIQGADTLHTLGHIRSARQMGAPMDAIQLAWGVQRNVYHKQTVTPRQHIGRASGGPLTSAVITSGALLSDSLVRRIPILSAISEAWLFTNAITLIGSLTPLPPLDGWSIVKWGVVQHTGDEAQGKVIADQAGRLTIGVAILGGVLWLIRGGLRKILPPLPVNLKSGS